jgi:four helix bundle protein
MPGDRVSNKICDQLIRSGTSVIGNYTEGKSASSRKDFTNYLTISLKSANESKLWFALLRDSNKAKKEEVQWFLNELDEISRILASSVLTLKSKK